jgi:hypothetical protein
LLEFFNLLFLSRKLSTEKRWRHCLRHKPEDTVSAIPEEDLIKETRTGKNVILPFCILRELPCSDRKRIFSSISNCSLHRWSLYKQWL